MTGAADWRGRVGDVWAEEHARTERAFAGIAAALGAAMAAAAPLEGRAADLGCGVGGTALALAALRPRLSITGIDLSPALIAVARERVARAARAEPEREADAAAASFVVGDVLQELPVLAPFDLLVSRHGLMFFAEPVTAFVALRAAAAPGAPLVFSCFAERARNDWVTAPEAVVGVTAEREAGYAPGPFALADETFVRTLLDRSGWQDVRLAQRRVAYQVGAGENPVEDALAFYRHVGPLASLLAASQPADRVRREAALRDLFATRIRDGAVTFSAAISIVTARAGKEAA